MPSPCVIWYTVSPRVFGRWRVGGTRIRRGGGGVASIRAVGAVCRKLNPRFCVVDVQGGGGGDKKEEEEEKKPKQTAAGRALAERMARQREEEERIRKLQVRAHDGATTTRRRRRFDVCRYVYRLRAAMVEGAMFHVTSFHVCEASSCLHLGRATCTVIAAVLRCTVWWGLQRANMSVFDKTILGGMGK